MRGGCELHGREENRSEGHGEEQAPRVLMQTPFLSFLPFLNNLTVHTNSHLVLSNLPHHENNTKILFVGQHKGQKTTARTVCRSSRNTALLFDVLARLIFRRHFPFYRCKPSGFHLALHGYCLLKTLLRDLLILGIHSQLRQGGKKAFRAGRRQMMAPSIACWASVREMSSCWVIYAPELL